MLLRTLAALGAALFIMSPAAAAAAEPTLPVNYIAVDDLVTPVVDDYRMLGTLQIRLALKVDDKAARARLATAKPRLVDAFNRALADFARLRVDPSRPVDINRLSAALQTTTARLAPAGTVQVLVLEAVVRRA